MFPKFKVEEWVILVDGPLSGFGGYIERYDYSDGTYRVMLATNKNGELSSGAAWMNEWNLIKDEPVLDESEIKQLMDLALDTKDKTWFMELSQQLEGVTI